MTDRKELLEDWLGGLDSNQDSQIQNLKSCQLDDLPTALEERNNKNESQHVPGSGTAAIHTI